MRLLRDPLLHFLLIGAALFGLYGLTSGGDEAEPGEIVVSAGHIANMQATFARTWQRPPTAEEMDGIVQDYIRDEVLYREAVGMGLDKDNSVVRRRLRQKMEFVADVMAETEPTDTELKTFVAEHREQFRAEPRFSFSHVYFKASPDGLSAAEIERLTSALNAGMADAAGAGDPFLSGFEFRDLTRSGVAQAFGGDFAAWVDKAAPGAWAGPVTSAYGVHLVRVSERIEAHDPPFEEIRDAARREWLHAGRVAANDALYEKLRARYVVKIEDAAAPSSKERLAEAMR